MRNRIQYSTYHTPFIGHIYFWFTTLAIQGNTS
jgi:hypothetical protein